MRAANKLTDAKTDLPQLGERFNAFSTIRKKGSGFDSSVSEDLYHETAQKKAMISDATAGPLIKKRIDWATEEMILALAIEQPLLGQQSVSEELRKKGISAAASTIYGIWQRHNLETFQKRMSALQDRISDRKIELSEAQLAAIKKRKEADIKKGNLETFYPGYLGTQDTYCPGSVKGLGKIYQQTFLDTYSKVAFVKVYDSKNELATADLLNDRVIPFYKEQQTTLQKILTDRGTEYCGSKERHLYQLNLVAEHIEHSKTETKNPQINGACDGFHRIIQDEFYTASFWNKTYHTLNALQKDIDEWMAFYNTQRTMYLESGIYKTPFQLFEEGKVLIKQSI